MKESRFLNSKAVVASRKCSLKRGSIGIKNSTKKTNRLNHKARGEGCGDERLDEKEDQLLPFKEAMRICPELSDKDTFLIEKRPALELCPGKALISSAKIKLQLFPINKGTQIGLEKDGHNPYLELTLRGQKKISSVLKHLEKKWGSSRIAKGEPILFPYNIKENLSNCRRWTNNDSDITAAAVYDAVGSPAIFRLRYGWFCVHEPRSFGIPSPIPFEAGEPSEGAQGGCNTKFETLYDKCDNVEVTNKENKAIDVGDATNAVVAQKMNNASVEPLDNDPRASSSVQQSLSLWVDSLANISIGGLLSEASLQGRFSVLDPKSYGSNAGMQPSQIISDSLDAFIAAQISHPPVSRLCAEDLRTSILDAEETCHAFPLQKLSSPAVDVHAARGKDYSAACSQDLSSNSLKLSNTDKVNDQDGVSQNPASGRTQTDMLVSSRTYDDERSLGLTGIKWNDSLGPFDLGMPVKKITGGDSVSIGGFVR